MKQLTKRTLALVLVVVLAGLAFMPYVAYADEPEETYEATEETIEETIEVGTQSRTAVTIREETYFSFTPNATGYWTFVTSNIIGTSDPELRVTNNYGHIMALDSGTAPNNNAIVKLHLVEGAHYIIWAGVRWGTMGSFTLTVYMSDTFTRPTRPVPVPTVIPGEGGMSRGQDQLLYSFSPQESGLWSIEIEAEAIFEIEISDSFGNFIGGTLDSRNDHFFATMRLVADETYRIRSWGLGGVWYTITISPAESFEPWIDWDMLAEWDIAVDFDADMSALSPHGGHVSVNDTVQLSFTPYTSGLWLFEIYENFDNPVLLITDTYGSFIFAEEIWSDNQWLFFTMEADVEYILWASSFWGGNVDFSMYISYYEPEPVDYDLDYDEPAPDIIHTDRGTRIPSHGGYVIVGDEHTFHFSPATTGSWTVQLIGDSSWTDLLVSDISGSFVLQNWAGRIISLYMAQYAEYIFETWAEQDDTLIFVSPTYEITFPGSAAHTTRMVTNETEFVFVPNISGYWLIYTTNNIGQTDPYLWLYDAEGNIIAQDDDGGEGLNAMIKIHLDAGTQHTIRAGFFAGTGEYRLNVRRAGGMPVRDLVVLNPPG